MPKLGWKERDVRRNGPMEYFFGLSRAAFLVLPRLAIQEMPVEWQERLKALLKEISPLLPRSDDYDVRRRGKGGKLVSDPWRDYRHSTVDKAREHDRYLGLEEEESNV